MGSNECLDQVGVEVKDRVNDEGSAGQPHPTSVTRPENQEHLMAGLSEGRQIRLECLHRLV